MPQLTCCSLATGRMVDAICKLVVGFYQLAHFVRQSRYWLESIPFGGLAEG